MVKSISLDGRYNTVTITDIAYEQIITLVNANRVCGTCGQPYTNDFPNVALNLCLECFQKKYEQKKLTYVGVLTVNEKGDMTHQFIDRHGHISLTGTTSEHEPSESIYYTLLYWQFPVPEKVMQGEKEVELSSWNWRIYGDVKTNAVLYIEHDSRLSDSKGIAFLTTRNGAFEEVNRRKGRYQKLFKEARARLEATKDSHGYYHVNGHEVYGLYDAYIYEGVAALASQEHDSPETK